jgi:glycogen phosphorylase
LLRTTTVKDLAEMFPERFSNKTNGVTPRRWLVLSNPSLASLITEHIGEGWIKDLSQLVLLEPLAENPEFRARWRAIKQENKRRFASLALERTGTSIDPATLFDVLVKRIHEYKRQHLKVLHIVSLYHTLKSNPGARIEPRTFIFGGKAAPGYHLAKLMIKLITSVGDVINRDPDVAERLKVVFLPNFNVTNGQNIYPAADLSEQISTAGKEASGTGNMKFCMNGALTIGTLDGANIELREEIGAKNFFLFGLTAQEVLELKSRGYRPMDYYAADAHLREVIDLIRSGYFTRGDTEMLRPLMDNLMHHDPYMLFADFASYVECQGLVSESYRDADRWTRMSILNTARSGTFSSDRTIRQYCEDIWHARAVPIRLLTHEETLAHERAQGRGRTPANGRTRPTGSPAGSA